MENGHAADATDAPQPLRLIVQPCEEDEGKDDWFFFSFFRVIEHRWNEIDRRKPKYSGTKPVPMPLYTSQVEHGLGRDRTRSSAVR
jgi:hypothetical protein